MTVRVLPIGRLTVTVVLFACAMRGGVASAQAPLPVPVTRAQFESNLSQLYSCEILESTRGERVAVSPWDGRNHRLIRWAANGKEEQRFAGGPRIGRQGPPPFTP